MRYTTYLSYAIMAVFAMVLTIISPLVPEIARSFSLNLTQSGIIFTANFVGFVIFILGGGVLADRIGKKPVLIFSLIGFSLGLSMFPLAPNFETACFVMALIGGCGGILESQLGAVITALNPENTGFYMNLSQVFFGFGAIAGPFLAAAAIARGYSWQFCYSILAGLSWLLTLSLFPAQFTALHDTDKICWKGFKGLILDPRFLLICFCMFLYTGSEVGGWGWLSTFLKTDLGFSATQSSLAVGLFWAAMTLGRIGCGPFILRYSSRTIVIILAFCSALVTALSGFTAGNWSWPVIFLMGLAYSSIWPLLVAFGGEQYPVYSGTVFALLVGTGGLGGAVIPYLIGIVGQNAGIRPAMMSPAVCFLLVALILIGYGKVPRTK